MAVQACAVLFAVGVFAASPLPSPLVSSRPTPSSLLFPSSRPSSSLLFTSSLSFSGGYSSLLGGSV